MSLARVAPPSEESTSRVGKAARLREKKNKGAVQNGLRNVRMQIGGRRAPIGRVRVADLLRERGDLALLRKKKKRRRLALCTAVVDLEPISRQSRAPSSASRSSSQSRPKAVARSYALNTRDPRDSARFREIPRDSPRFPERRVPLLGNTALCSVFRAPCEYEQHECSDYSGFRVLSSAGWSTRRVSSF